MHRLNGGRAASFAILLTLAACGTSGQATVADLCAQDARLQPIAAADAPLVEAVLVAAGQPVPAGGVAAAMAVDQAGVHNALQAACKRATAAK